MRLTRSNKFLPILFIFIFLYLLLSVFLKNGYALNIKVETYVVTPDNSGGELQSVAISKALKLALKKAVSKLIGEQMTLNKDNSDMIEIINKSIFSNKMKYIYSFKIIKAKGYLNLYYININVSIREKELRSRLEDLGFNVVKNISVDQAVKYNTYYIKFMGKYKYADSNKLQKLMIKYSKHLKNLYVSSFSVNFVEIKILYYGSIIRLLKSVKSKVKTYLDADVYPVKGGVIVVDVN